jgi:hypothetical protein
MELLRMEFSTFRVALIQVLCQVTRRIWTSTATKGHHRLSLADYPPSLWRIIRRLTGSGSGFDQERGAGRSEQNSMIDRRNSFRAASFSTTRQRAKSQWKTEAPPEPCPEVVFERVVYPKRLRASL